MTESRPEMQLRFLSEQQVTSLYRDVLKTAKEERPVPVLDNLKSVERFVRDGISMIQDFEQLAEQGPEVRPDTDVVYLDSGPGPIAVKLLPHHNRYQYPDSNYHKFPWSAKMDRQRVIAGYGLAREVTVKRIEERVGIEKLPGDLTPEDFSQFGPFLMYTSTDWQNSHVEEAIKMYRKLGLFKIPDSKLFMYDTYFDKSEEEHPIIHTEDQVEGFIFPRNKDGMPPRNVAIVSHPAHLMRIMHVLGKYSDTLPPGTSIQAFPIPTPLNGIIEYAKAELLGTIGTVLSKDRASFTPYHDYA